MSSATFRPATAGRTRAPRRVRQQAWEALLLMIFSAAVSLGLALTLIGLVSLGRG